MIVKLGCNWRQALATNFRPDRVRKEAVVFRKKKLTCVVPKMLDTAVHDVRQWFVDNEVKKYGMFSLYNVATDGRVYYHGLAFDFTEDDHALMFKLSFN